MISPPPEVVTPVSPHHSPRAAKIDAIILHDTGSRTARSALEWFHNINSLVSAHIVIDQEGTIFRVVPDELKAWHAGDSIMFHKTHVNTFSLGIELVDNSDRDTYSQAQLNACAAWCAYRCLTYGIPLNRIVGHEHIARPMGRKTDPGPDFPWTEFLLDVASRVLEGQRSGGNP